MLCMAVPQLTAAHVSTFNRMLSKSADEFLRRPANKQLTGPNADKNITSLAEAMISHSCCKSEQNFVEKKYLKNENYFRILTSIEYCNSLEFVYVIAQCCECLLSQLFPVNPSAHIQLYLRLDTVAPLDVHEPPFRHGSELQNESAVRSQTVTCYAPPLIDGGIKRCFCLKSVWRLSVWRVHRA